MPDEQINGVFSGCAVFCDLDGTLLTDKKSISDENRAAVRRFVSLGGLFFIATGRSARSTRRFHEALELEMPVIVFNGAAVFDYGENRLTPIASLKKADATDFVKRLLYLAPECGAEIYADGEYYMLRENPQALAHAGNERASSAGSTIEETPESWQKVIFSGEPSAVSALKAAAEQKAPAGVRVILTSPIYLEIMSCEADKLNAANILAEKFSIARERRFSIGDFHNDVDMLKAMYSAAPSNAVDEAKAAADIIVGANNESAVADFIEAVERRLCGA